MKTAASLLVYNPIEWFEGPDSRYWRDYVDSYRETGARHGDAFREAFLRRVGLRDENDIIHAYIREWRGRTLLCPSYGKVGIDQIIPEIVASLPESLRERARNLARRARITHLYHRRAEPTRLPAAYHPLTFFLLFLRSERRKRLRPPGRPAEAGYVTDLRKARMRLERLRRAVIDSGEPPHVLREVDALREFLTIHHEDAVLEMRFLRPDDDVDRGWEDPVVQEVRERVQAANRGILFPGGVLSGLRLDP